MAETWELGHSSLISGCYFIPVAKPMAPLLGFYEE
jgi:hypothetical protein